MVILNDLLLLFAQSFNLLDQLDVLGLQFADVGEEVVVGSRVAVHVVMVKCFRALFNHVEKALNLERIKIV